MDISYLGHSSFLIKSKGTKIITDPFDSKMVGLPFSKQEAHIVTISHAHEDHNDVSRIGGEPVVLDWPGEFEIKGIRIFGYQSFHDASQGSERGENIMYKFETEDMAVLHCGDLGHALDTTLIDQVGNIDILMIPVGGTYTVTAGEAAKITHKLDPSIVIPMHYGHEKLNQEVFQELQPVDLFIKEMAAEPPAPVDKFTVKKEDLTDATRIAVFKF